MTPKPFALPLLLRFFCLLPFALLGAAQPAWADPPVLAGRVAEVSGDAWVFDAENRNWQHLERNQTVAQGDQIRTDPRARLSLRIGSSSVWMDEQSDIELAQLDEGHTTLRLLTGTVALRLRTQLAVSETLVQTREGLVTAESEGLFRIRQSNRGTTLATLQGRARFESDPARPVQRAWLREGEQAEFWFADGPRIEHQPVGSDAFSGWVLAEDSQQARVPIAITERYVSPEMTGVDVLEQNGNWEPATEYGTVWIPARLPPDWAPYRYGHWGWTRHWGWSWVDDAPWGFAPFHYGRWVEWRGRWCWAPGRYAARPAYAPALVAWVGGPSVTVVVGGGARPQPHIGWRPLGTRDSYVPSHPHSPSYASRVGWVQAVDNAVRPVQHGHSRDSRDSREPRDTREPRNSRDYRDSHADNPAAFSYLPGAGSPVRPMPTAGAAPAPIRAPGRAELPVSASAQQPVQGPPTPQGPTPTPWRDQSPGSSGRDRRDGGRDGGRDGEHGQREPQRPQPVVVTVPNAPAPVYNPAPVATPQQQQYFPPSPAQAPVPPPTQADRPMPSLPQPVYQGPQRYRDRDGDEERVRQRAAPVQTPLPAPAPVPVFREEPRPAPAPVSGPAPRPAEGSGFGAAVRQAMPQPEQARPAAKADEERRRPGRDKRDREVER